MSSGGNADAGSANTLDRGLAGVEQASRAATLLALIVDPTATSPPSTAAAPFAQDVAEILRAHARRIGSRIESEFDVASLTATDIGPAAIADALLAGFAALDRQSQSASASKAAE